MRLTTSPLFGAELASSAALKGCAGLYVPHDGEPVADVQHRPDRWALLQLVTEAVRRDIPILGWGSGAALLGRVLGAKVHQAEIDWSEAPRGATVHEWHGELPLHWTHGRVTAWAEVDLPEPMQLDFLASLPGLTSRRPATPLEEVGGEEVLRILLTDFYSRARADDLLGPIFEVHIHDWEAHLERVTVFWATMLGGLAADGGGWKGNLNTVHAGLGIRGAHLQRWLELFSRTTQTHLLPGQAELLLSRARIMAQRLSQGKGDPRRNQLT